MFAGFSVKGGPGEKSEFVSVLAGGWNTDGARPVVVEVGQLVAEALKLVGLEARLVHDDIVAGRVHCTLSDGLGDEKKVVSFWKCDNVIHHGATERVAILARMITSEQTGVDSLRYNYECDFGIVVRL